jgi:hypothetical protein
MQIKRVSPDDGIHRYNIYIYIMEPLPSHRVSRTGYRSHLDKLVYLNLAPRSTWQPSLLKYIY